MTAMGDVANWSAFFIGGWGTTFSAYVVIQALTIFTLKRPYLFASLIPLSAMLVVGLITISAYRGQSNVWPILLVLASPVALLAVAAVEIIGVRVQAHPRRQTLTAITVGMVVPAFLLLAYVFAYAA